MLRTGAERVARRGQLREDAEAPIVEPDVLDQVEALEGDGNSTQNSQSADPLVGQQVCLHCTG
jgi:hypothetical protein